MIPKIIHYCWFGRGQKNDLTLKCIDSWKKYAPDYIIKEWNEDNFDLNQNRYIKEAYEHKKWAFITDYVRLYVLVNEGGIYVDTDLELCKSLDCFLEERAFSGFESNNFVPTGIMASEAKFPLFEELLHYYDDISFVNDDGSLNLTTNTQTITKHLISKGLLLNNSTQTINGFTLYSSDYFCPKSHETGLIESTQNTYTIHHFAGSWLPKTVKFRNKVKDSIKKLLGPEISKKIVYLKRKMNNR